MYHSRVIKKKKKATKRAGTGPMASWTASKSEAGLGSLEFRAGSYRTDDVVDSLDDCAGLAIRQVSSLELSDTKVYEP